MYQFFVEPNQIHIDDKSVIITGKDVNHIKNVLRMRPGEEISVSNGLDGREYHCAIRSLEEICVQCELLNVKEDGAELPSGMYLFPGVAQI